MFRHSSIRYIFVIGILIAFFLDGSLSYNLSSLFYQSYSIMSCLTLLWLVFALFFVRNYELHLGIWAMVVGALFDWYYTGILGVFLFVFPFIIYVSKFLSRYLSVNFLSRALIYLIDLLILLGLNAIANHFVSVLMGMANGIGLRFLIFSSFLTVLLNLFIFGILYFPMQIFYNYCQEK